jgi:hypothetical protein
MTGFATFCMLSEEFESRPPQQNIVSSSRFRNAQIKQAFVVNWF